jgi:hypothetical protein
MLSPEFLRLNSVLCPPNSILATAFDFAVFENKCVSSLYPDKKWVYDIIRIQAKIFLRGEINLVL